MWGAGRYGQGEKEGRGVNGKGHEGERQKNFLPSVCLDIYMHKSAGITHTHKAKSSPPIHSLFNEKVKILGQSQGKFLAFQK